MSRWILLLLGATTPSLQEEDDAGNPVVLLTSSFLPIYLVPTSFQGGEIHPRGAYVHPCQLEMATTAIPKCSQFPLIGEGQQRVPETHPDQE